MDNEVTGDSSVMDIRRIQAIYRLNNSASGNPRYAIAFSDGESYISMSDASFCYAVGNPGMRVGDVVSVEFTRAGRIRYMKPYIEENWR